MENKYANSQNFKCKIMKIENEKQAEAAIKAIIKFIGEDTESQDLIGTPKRVVKMWKELFRGYDKEQRPKVTKFANGYNGINKTDELIIDEGDFYSHCSHHIIPFFGKYYFAYIPSEEGAILGLSKVGRMVDFYAAKMQIQEKLTSEIVEDLWKDLSDGFDEPLGMALVMKGEHLCKTMRGAKKKGQMTTVKLKGIFKTDARARAEFMTLIK